MSVVMSESASVVHVKQEDRENGNTATSAPRRPRNREVNSRYKSTIPAAPVLNSRRYPTPTSTSDRRHPTPTSTTDRRHPTPTPLTTTDRRYPTPTPTTDRRYPTPNLDRASNASEAVPSPKRSLSAERRRASPLGRNSDSKVASKDAIPIAARRPPGVPTELLWPSTRNLSSSVQLESNPPAPQSRKLSETRGKANGVTSDHTLRPSANIAPKAGEPRKPTPERKVTPRRIHVSSDQSENAKPQENIHKPEPQRGRPLNGITKLSAAALSKSVDLSAERERAASRTSSVSVHSKLTHINSRSVSTTRSRPSSANELPAYPTGLPRTRSESRGRMHDSPQDTYKYNRASPPSVSSRSSDQSIDQTIHAVGQAIELTLSETVTVNDNASDTDSISSGGTTNTSSSGWTTPGSITMSSRVRGTTVPAQFLQDAPGRTRRMSEHNRMRASMPESELLAAAASLKQVSRYKTSESPRASTIASPWAAVSGRSVSSLVPPQTSPHSPIKTSPYRNIPSPSRSRGGPPTSAHSQRSGGAAMMLNFGPDARKAKKGLSQVEEIHLHRILHNRLLQWRFVNARAEGALNMQTFAAEKALYNVCVRIFDLRSSVAKKKMKLQHERQSEKLNSLLSAQAPKLDVWSDVQHEHSIALKGFVQALEAAVLRVPVTGGVKADAQSVRNAISSAFDVMNTIENSVGYLLPKADKTNSLLSELGYVASQERLLLEECSSLLATVSALEAEECSLRTHLVQLEHERDRVLGHLMDDTPIAADSVLI